MPDPTAYSVCGNDVLHCDEITYLIVLIVLFVKSQRLVGDRESTAYCRLIAIKCHISSLSCFSSGCRNEAIERVVFVLALGLSYPIVKEDWLVGLVVNLRDIASV